MNRDFIKAGFYKIPIYKIPLVGRPAVVQHHWWLGGEAGAPVVVVGGGSPHQGPPEYSLAASESILVGSFSPRSDTSEYNNNAYCCKARYQNLCWSWLKAGSDGRRGHRARQRKSEPGYFPPKSAPEQTFYRKLCSRIVLCPPPVVRCPIYNSGPCDGLNS